MTNLTPVFAAAAALIASSAAASGTTIQPGYWESTNTVVSPFYSSKTERRCITPSDVDKFMAGPSNRHYDCVYPSNRITGGKIHLKGTCTSHKGRKVAVSGSGTYTLTSFHLDAIIATTFWGIPLSGRASTDARRIGDSCPAPESPSSSQ